MSKEMREEKEREFRIKVNDIKTLQKKYEVELQGIQKKLMAGLQSETLEIIDEIGKSGGYLLIMDKRGVLYSHQRPSILPMKSLKNTMPSIPKTRKNKQVTVPTEFSLQDIAEATNGDAIGKKIKKFAVSHLLRLPVSDQITFAGGSKLFETDRRHAGGGHHRPKGFEAPGKNLIRCPTRNWHLPGGRPFSSDDPSPAWHRQNPSHGRRRLTGEGCLSVRLQPLAIA
jgi:hypothetical protein